MRAHTEYLTFHTKKRRDLVHLTPQLDRGNPPGTVEQVLVAEATYQQSDLIARCEAGADGIQLRTTLVRQRFYLLIEAACSPIGAADCQRGEELRVGELRQRLAEPHFGAAEQGAVFADALQGDELRRLQQTAERRADGRAG